MDAKYKLYNEEKLSSADIYQMFLYAFAYGKAHPVRPTALVVYPASSTSGGYVRLHIRQRGSASAELRVVPIHIPTALKEARLRTGSMGDAVIAAVTRRLANQSRQLRSDCWLGRRRIKLRKMGKICGAFSVPAPTATPWTLIQAISAADTSMEA